MRDKCASHVLQLSKRQLEYSNWYANCSIANWSTWNSGRNCGAMWLFYKEVFGVARGGNRENELE